ncbi:hypothetical protein [Natrinema sp. SYSU A 869]|uniref:hypothetical protein n=1 Tax=Natrinema sp. SYSU A 869 TaxID=2871694 RepID=UPI0021053B6A|nr:hypothetical protein [Natrinema sp. SYSU A 869]
MARRFGARYASECNSISISDSDTIVTSPDHVRSNAAVSDLEPLSNRAHGAARGVYEEYVAEHVHHRW